MCEYVRLKVCVRVGWCMSGSVRSHVWAMVYVCASARACLGNLWCVFVCVSLCVCENVCTRFVKGGPIRRTFFVSTGQSRNSTSFLLHQI